MHGRIPDNSQRLLKSIFDCCDQSESRANVEAFIHGLAGKTLEDLCKENKNLLVFPRELIAANHDNDDIGSNCIFLRSESDFETKLQSGNIMGFVGWKGVSLTISSRFYSSSDDNDYFLHYLLQKVAGFHAVDLPPPTMQNPVWDFLPYLFPAYFMVAWKQGIYKATRRLVANDDRIKGPIDIARHIRENMPFRGNVAYSFTTRTPINPVNQLIRLTIDVLDHSPYFKAMFHGANKAFNDAVRDFKLLVPVEALGDRSKIIKNNLRPITHPFYLKYKPLQKLCLAILRHEKISFGTDNKEVIGLLFDGAWLWEEYLARLMPPSIMHAQNKQGVGGYEPAREMAWGRWMPDFYKKRTLVFDAKYKNPNSEDSHRADRHQIVAYMHTLKADCGGFIYPGKDAQECKIGKVTLNGYGGSVYQLQIPIPAQASSYPNFMAEMGLKEQEFMGMIEGLLAKDAAEGKP